MILLILSIWCNWYLDSLSSSLAPSMIIPSGLHHRQEEASHHEWFSWIPNWRVQLLTANTTSTLDCSVTKSQAQADIIISSLVRLPTELHKSAWIMSKGPNHISHIFSPKYSYMVYMTKRWFRAKQFNMQFVQVIIWVAYVAESLDKSKSNLLKKNGLFKLVCKPNIIDK